MEAIQSKIMLVIVAVMIIGILASFSGRLLEKNEPKEVFDSISGDRELVMLEFEERCAQCLGPEDVNRDCFIVEVKLEGQVITVQEFSDLFGESDDIEEGQHAYKIKSENGKCVVINVD